MPSTPLSVPFIKDSPSYGKTILARRNDVRDVAKRLGFVKPDDIRLRGSSTRRIAAVFNGTGIIEKGNFKVYARVVIGYYKYVSAIASIVLDASEILSGFGELNREIDAEILITPDTWIDFWGAEDPRFSIVDDREVLVYTGRTLSYFAAKEYTPGRTFPVIATRRGGAWRKISYIALPHGFEALIQSDKDSFIVNSGHDDYLVFHRPHEVSGRHHTLISIAKDIPWEGHLAPLVLEESWRVINQAPFEEKIGWGPSAIEVSRGRFLVLLHGVESETQVYRVFAAIIEYNGKEPPRATAVTPHYIMEPRTPEEKYGDRPMVVFPCGATVLDDKLIVTYGAADTALGIAEIDLSELLHVLDSNTIE